MGLTGRNLDPDLGIFNRGIHELGKAQWLESSQLPWRHLEEIAMLCLITAIILTYTLLLACLPIGAVYYVSHPPPVYYYQNVHR